MNHPNAAAAGGSSALAILILWLAGSVFHWSVSAEEGALLAGVVASAVLFVGRNGVKGLWKRVWGGETS